MTKFLFALDTPSIKKFVFGTDKLAEIAGASGLLDDLNREKTPVFFERLSAERIYCNGGKGLFVLKSSFAELDELIAKLESMYLEQTGGGARIVCAYIPYEEDVDFQIAMQRLALKLEERHYDATVSMHMPFMKECESCGQNPAEYVDECICRVCRYKRNRRKEIQKIWKELFEYLPSGHELEGSKWHHARPKNFEEIGDRYKSGRIGLVYADGNAMGKIFRRLNAPELVKLFSNTVDSSIRKACYQSLVDTCYDKDTGKIYCDILLLGGDDLVVVVPAENALEFARKAGERFQMETREALNRKKSEFAEFFDGDRSVISKKGLTICLGVVFGKVKQPFHMLLGQAEELLKSAKKCSTQKQVSEYLVPAHIDFHDATQSAFSKVEQARQHYWMKTFKGRWKIIQRPYSLEDLGKLSGHAQKLLDSGWPNSKLQDLRSACFETPRMLYHSLISMLSRVEKKQEKVLLGALEEFDCSDLLSFFLPREQKEEKERSAMLLDLLEVASYLPRKGGR